MSRPEVETRPPTPADIDALVRDMRPQDVAECRAAGIEPARAVRIGIEQSVWCLAARVNGETGCIFGIAQGGSVLVPFGVPWLLGTPLVPRHRRALARLAPAYIARMLQTHPHLRNHVHDRNTVAVSWLRRMGFALGPVHPHPVTGEPFRT